MVKDKENHSLTKGRLTLRLAILFILDMSQLQFPLLRHTYMPKFQVDCAGPSYFGGKNSEMVLCTGKGEACKRYFERQWILNGF